MKIGAEVNLKIIPADWTIRRVPPNIEIKTQKPEVLLDYKENRTSIGYRDSYDLQGDYSQKAFQAAEEGISRRVAEGEILKDVHHRSGFPEIAQRQEASDLGTPTLKYIKPVNVKAIIEFPKVSVQLGRISLDYVPGKVQIDAHNIDVKV